MTGDFSDLVPMTATSTSSLPNLQPMAWPESMQCSLAPVISLPESFDRLNGKSKRHANQVPCGHIACDASASRDKWKLM